MTTQSSLSAETPPVPWWLVLIEGIAAVLVGLMLFARPAATTILLVQFLGVYWLVTGVFSIVSLLWNRSAWGWKLFSGILGIAAGLLIIRNPLWSTLLVPSTLAFMLGAIGIVIGFLQLVDAFRGAGWGTGILGGLSILLGFLLIARPVIAGLALPWILGGLLVFGGFLAIFASFGLRNLQPQPETVTPAVRPAAAVAAAGSVNVAPAPVEPEPVVSVSTAAVAAVEDVVVDTGDGGAGAETVLEDSSAAGALSEQAVADVVEEIPEVNALEVEDADLTGNVSHDDPEEMAKFKYSLEYVEGIGPVFGARLKEIGLVTCLDLLKSGATRKGREEIVEKSGISGTLVLKWINHVDLYRIKGVGSEYADLLEAAGVDTVVELGHRNAGHLFDKLNQVNSDRHLVRKMPTDAQVEDWVNQAKSLPRVVTY